VSGGIKKPLCQFGSRIELAASSTLERFDEPLGVDEAQARQLPDTAHGVHGLPVRHKVIDFGLAPLVQKASQLFTSPAVSFLPGR
jgi:hypothetical protein